MTNETRITYSFEQLLKLRDSAASNKWPSEFSVEHKNADGVWDPVAAYNVRANMSYGRPRRQRLNTDGPRPKRNGLQPYMNPYVGEFSPPYAFYSPSKHYSMQWPHYYNYPMNYQQPRYPNWIVENSNYSTQDKRAVETKLLEIIKGSAKNSQKPQQKRKSLKNNNNINKLRSQDPSIISISCGEGKHKLEKTNEIENYLKTMLLHKPDQENVKKTSKATNGVTLEEIERQLICDDVSARATSDTPSPPSNAIPTESLEHLFKMLQSNV